LDENIKFGLILVTAFVLLGSFLFFMFSVMGSITCHWVTNSVVIDGQDVKEYMVLDDGDVEITMNNGFVYTVVVTDNVVDFTVNSDIFIELYQTDISYWWWESTVWSEKYYIESIVKIPGDMNKEK